jgi:hypothetical protein
MGLGVKRANTFAFTQPDFSVAENKGSIALTVTRTSGKTGAATIHYATSDGTAKAGTDYTAKIGTLTFAAGVTSMTIPIAILNKDTLFKGDRSFSVTLSNPTGGPALGTPATATVTIQDEDIAALRFSLASYTVAENLAAGVATVTVSRTGGTGPVSVNYATTDGTAKAGTDYAATSGTVSLAAGQLSKTFTIPLINNTVAASTRNFSVALSDPSTGAALGTPVTATVNITDDDKAGTLQFSLAAVSVKEDAGPAVLTVTRTLGLASGVTVAYATADKLAVAGSDYTAASGTLTFAAGETAKTISVPVTKDFAVEINKTFTVTLSNPTGGAILGTNKISTVTITNDDAPGSLQFATATASVPENAGQAAIVVNRVNGATGPVSVYYTTSNGTALTGTDYTITLGTLNFAEGETSKTILVPILDNKVINVNKTFKMTLSLPTGGAKLGTPIATTVTIVNDDIGGAIQFSPAAYTVDETAQMAELTIVRTGTGTLAGGVTVKVATVAEAVAGKATSGKDYTPVSTILTFAEGEATKTIRIPLLDDTIFEPSETIKTTLSLPTGGATVPAAAASAVVTILNDDLGGTIQFSSATYRASESGGPAAITVTRTGGTASAVTVKYATVAETGVGKATVTKDYTAAAGTLTFGAGETEKIFTVPILADALVELDETVKLTLSTVTGGATLGTPATATLTIMPPVVGAPPVVVPNGGTVSFSQAEYITGEEFALVTVVRTGGTGPLAVTYAAADGTAIAGSDYTEVSGRLTFAKGETSKTFQIPVLKNPARKSPATVILTLEDPENGGLGAIPAAILTIAP